MKVSIVSVSRRAGPPHFGQVVFTNAASDLSGLLPLPGVVDVSGSRTGSWSSGTGTMPSVSQ
jgi:hypothetical protein